MGCEGTRCQDGYWLKITSKGHEDSVRLSRIQLVHGISALSVPGGGGTGKWAFLELLFLQRVTCLCRRPVASSD